MSRALFGRKLRESDREEPARLARLPELTLVSARELGQGAQPGNKEKFKTDKLVLFVPCVI